MDGVLVTCDCFAILSGIEKGRSQIYPDGTFALVISKSTRKIQSFVVALNCARNVPGVCIHHPEVCRSFPKQRLVISPGRKINCIRGWLNRIKRLTNQIEEMGRIDQAV